MEPKTETATPASIGIDTNRSPGGARWILVSLVIASIALVSVWIWSIRRVDELPDLGEPCDFAAVVRPIAIDEADNAFTGYAAAYAVRVKVPSGFRNIDFETETWSKAAAGVREYLENSRPALEKWREASERPDALYHQPGELAVDTMLTIVQEMAQLSRIAALEGARHEEAGRMDEAWRWYRAMLRASRHVGRRGVIIERMVGAAQHKIAAARILRWAADGRTDLGLLRHALADVLAADALTPPLSDNLKLEYAMYLRDLHELRVMINDVSMPGGRFGWMEQVVKSTGLRTEIQRVRLHATNDVERSRRAVQLLFANWLAQVDKPAGKRAPIAIAKPLLIYAFDPDSAAARHGVTAESLDRALTHTALAQAMFRDTDPQPGGYVKAPWEGDGPLARETRRRAVLIVRLAAELYRREKGRAPATAGELVGPYLKALPEEIDPGDPIPAAIE